MKLLSKIPSTSDSSGDLYLSDSERFHMSLDVLHINYLVQNDYRFKNWAWFWREFVQWQALQVVLTEYCRQPETPRGQRAWAVLDPILSGWEEQVKSQEQSRFFEPVARLIAQTRRKEKKQRINGRARSTFNTIAKPSKDMRREEEQMLTPAPTLMDNSDSASLMSVVDTSTGSTVFESSLIPQADMPYEISEDLTLNFDDTLQDFDWEAWTATAQNMDFDLGFV